MMTPPARRRPLPRLARAAAAMLAGLLGSSCGGLLPQPPERQLYRAEPSFAFPAAGLPHARIQLAVATPTALDSLDTRRIALARSPVSLDYYADAEWADRVPLLVRTALIEGFEASGTVAAVVPEDLDLYADVVLETTIRDFEAVYGAPETEKEKQKAPLVVVALDLKLVQMPDRKIRASTLVRGEATAATNAIPAIVRAFDAALSRAVEAAVTWTVANPAAAAVSGKTGSPRSRAPPLVRPVGARTP
jgi:cholesterol transport system auxiliary component